MWLTDTYCRFLETNEIAISGDSLSRILLFFSLILYFQLFSYLDYKNYASDLRYDSASPSLS